LVVTYDAGLLHYDAATSEDDKIGDAANIVTRGELRIFFRVDLYHYRFARHVGRGARHFRSSGVAGAAPIGPEVDEDGNGRVLNNFIELRIVHRERFRDGRKRRFASSTTAGAGEIFGWDAIFLSAICASANDRHTRPPSY
jgi:hypothetical protein